MARVIAVPCIDDPRVAIFRSMKGRHFEKEGVFIAEGERVAALLLASGHIVRSVLVVRERKARFGSLCRKALRRGAVVLTLPERQIDTIVGFRFHQGIMALANIPKRLSLDGLFARRRKPRLIMALSGVQDPQNVGLIVRTSAALGADLIIVDSGTCDPYYRQAVRVSMGAIFSMPVVYTEDMEETLISLQQKHHTHVFAASPGRHRRTVSLERISFTGNDCIVMGNEDAGLDDKLIAIADTALRIPGMKKIDSLNVACAASICLWQAVCAGKKRGKV